MSALISLDPPIDSGREPEKKGSSIHPKKTHLFSDENHLLTGSQLIGALDFRVAQGSSHSLPRKTEEQLERVSGMSHPPPLKFHRPGCAKIL